MTDTDIAIHGELSEEAELDEALPVKLVHDSQAENKAAQISSWSSWVLQGTEPAFRILAQSEKRNRAVINLYAAAATTQVIIGKFNQMSNKQGFVLSAGVTIITEAAPEVWCIPNGQPCTISVEDEQYL